jgi:putative restriction endonuclease
MSCEEILGRFEAIAVWTRGAERAPHKPLLILYALGRWSRGDTSDIPYTDVDQDLQALLKEFGPPRKSFHTEYPFWRLQNDRIWTVHANRPMERRASNTDPRKSELIAHGARGGFAADVKSAFARQPSLVEGIAASILDHHFPPAIHARIRKAVGLAAEATGKRGMDL